MFRVSNPKLKEESDGPAETMTISGKLLGQKNMNIRVLDCPGFKLTYANNS